MRKIETNELKCIQLNILCIVDDFCKSHNINYWIDCGTLLGAVRHKGYIPWDDDIDIGMLRTDYEKFKKLFVNNSRYSFLCAENTNSYYFPFGKVVDNNTVLYEPNKQGYKIAVYIDVFVYDNAPDSDVALKKMYDERDFWRKLNNAQTGHHRKTNNLFKEIIVKIGYYFLKLFPKGYFNNKALSVCLKYTNSSTQRVGNFTSEKRMVCDKSIFESFVDLSFENHNFKAPVGYNKWLKAFYGNYMQLPPKDKRVSHHEFEAYYKD